MTGLEVAQSTTSGRQVGWRWGWRNVHKKCSKIVIQHVSKGWGYVLSYCISGFEHQLDKLAPIQDYSWQIWFRNASLKNLQPLLDHEISWRESPQVFGMVFPDRCKHKMETSQFWMKKCWFQICIQKSLTGACWEPCPCGNILRSMDPFDSRLILLESWFRFAVQK